MNFKEPRVMLSLKITSLLKVLLILLFNILLLLFVLLFSFIIFVFFSLMSVLIQHIVLYWDSKGINLFSFSCAIKISFLIILLISSFPFDFMNISIFLFSFNNESTIINPLHLICLLISSFKLTNVFKSSKIFISPPFLTINFAKVGFFKEM